jgi:hypothetical protein
MSAKVFVVHRKDYMDVKAAGVYGEVHVMFDGPVPALFDLNRLVWMIKDKLKDMSKDDYLALAGNMVVNAMALSVALESYKTVNILLFDVRDQRYTVRTMNRNQFVIGDLYDKQ